MIETLFGAYLFAWAAGTAAALGGLVLLAITELAGASWMVPFRRVAEAVASTLPLFALLFVPIALFAQAGYPWAGDPRALSPEVARAIEHKRAWLSIGPFVARSVVYFACWIAFAELLRRASIQQDDRAQGALFSRRRRLAAASLPVILLTGTSASFDWLMSLDPRWHSTAYGVLFLAGGFDAALAITVLVAIRVERDVASHGIEVRAAHWHALGNLLLAGVLVFAYVAFGQFLIHWIADVPREVEWYLPRREPGWLPVAWALVATFFAIPFAILLARAAKRAPKPLGVAAALVLAGHALAFALLALPSLGVARPRLVDVGALAVITALAAAFGALRFRRALPVPRNDAALPRALRFEMP